MTFSDAPRATGRPLSISLFQSSLPEVTCNACGDLVRRREPRMMLRASWRSQTEYLCPTCWGSIVQWAKRFALQQLELPQP